MLYDFIKLENLSFPPFFNNKISSFVQSSTSKDFIVEIFLLNFLCVLAHEGHNKTAFDVEHQ